MRPLWLALVLGLAGCALTPVNLRHPGTNDVRHCTGTYWSWGYFIAASAQDECVRDHEARGYQRMP
jgi:hypothetical protein